VISETNSGWPGELEASEDQVTRVLSRLGKPAAAALFQGKPNLEGDPFRRPWQDLRHRWIDVHSGDCRSPVKRVPWNGPSFPKQRCNYSRTMG